MGSWDTVVVISELPMILQSNDKPILVSLFVSLQFIVSTDDGEGLSDTCAIQ